MGDRTTVINMVDTRNTSLMFASGVLFATLMDVAHQVNAIEPDDSGPPGFLPRKFSTTAGTFQDHDHRVSGGQMTIGGDK